LRVDAEWHRIAPRFRDVHAYVYGTNRDALVYTYDTETDTLVVQLAVVDGRLVPG
jgi:hypothetical protein